MTATPQRALIRFLMQFIMDSIPADRMDEDGFESPMHRCEFDTAPDKGRCEFCERWGTAWVLAFPEMAEGQPNPKDPIPQPSAGKQGEGT